MPCGSDRHTRQAYDCHILEGVGSDSSPCMQSLSCCSDNRPHVDTRTACMPSRMCCTIVQNSNTEPNYIATANYYLYMLTACGHTAPLFLLCTLHTLLLQCRVALTLCLLHTQLPTLPAYVRVIRRDVCIPQRCLIGYSYVWY